MEEGVNGPKLNGFSLIQGCMTCVGELHVNDALTDAFLNVHKPSVNEGVNDDADSVCVESNASANVPRVGHSCQHCPQNEDVAEFERGELFHPFHQAIRKLA